MRSPYASTIANTRGRWWHIPEPTHERTTPTCSGSWNLTFCHPLFDFASLTKAYICNIESRSERLFSLLIHRFKTFFLNSLDTKWSALTIRLRTLLSTEIPFILTVNKNMNHFGSLEINLNNKPKLRPRKIRSEKKLVSTNFVWSWFSRDWSKTYHFYFTFIEFQEKGLS